MKYQSAPVVVEALAITRFMSVVDIVEPETEKVIGKAYGTNEDGSTDVMLEDGSSANLSADMLSAFMPNVGDYLMVFPTGETKLCYKDEFEAKYTKVA